MNIQAKLPKPLTLALASLMIPMGCAEDLKPTDNGPTTTDEGSQAITTTENQDGSLSTLVNASDNEQWRYFDFESRLEVEPETPETNQDWDVGFRRFNIKANGGISGEGQVAVAIMTGTSFDDLTTAPLGGYLEDAEDGDDDNEDPDFAFAYDSGWYSYDPTTHTLSPKDVVYVVRTVEGNYFKLQMTDYYDEAGSSGYPAFRWGPVDPPTDNDVIEVVADNAETWIYLSVASGGVVSPTDPETSTDWDLAISRTRFQTNGGASGAGRGGARIADAANYESVHASPTVGFDADAMIPLPGPPGSGEFAGNEVLNDWFDYDPAAHTVSPKDTVYLLRTADGQYGKLQILSYENGTYRLRLASVTRAPQVHTTTLEAGEEGVWTYVSFRNGNVVDIQTATTSEGWDLGVYRTQIRTNGGTSGPGEGGAFQMQSSSIDEITAAPADGYEADTMIPLPGPPGSGEFSGNAVLNDWFDYDPATHTVTPKEAAFVVKTADRGYVKLRVTGFQDGAVTMDWSYAGMGQSSWASP